MTSAPIPQTAGKSAIIGVLLMVIVAIIGATDAVIVRHLSRDIHPFVIGFTRALFGCLAFLPFLIIRPGVLRSQYRILHLVRAALKLGALVAFYFAYATAPLTDVTAIAFTAPLFVTVGAWLLLSESPRALRIVAVIVGFAGVLLVLRPGHSPPMATGLLLAFAGALLTAIIQLMLKPMTGRDAPTTLVAWNLIVSVPIAAIPASLYWTPPQADAWVLLALQGVLGGLNMGLVTRAFSLSEASLLVPIEFLRLPLVAALAYVAFGEVVAVTTWFGACTIFAATLLMVVSARHCEPHDTHPITGTSDRDNKGRGH